MDRWIGKVAVVTGASAGVGAFIAEKLTKEGLIVVGFARNKGKIEEIAEKLRGEKGKLHALKVDVANPDEVINAFKWIKDTLGPVHVLINNAAIALSSNLSDGDYDRWKKVIDVNVLGLCVATREAFKQMKENNIDGHIIHINSLTGHTIHFLPGLGTYGASKFAVTALAETLLNEVNNAKLKIKVSSVSPGAIKTGFREVGGYLPEGVTEDQLDYPALTAEEVADAVVYVVGTPPTVLSVSPGAVKTEFREVGGFYPEGVTDAQAGISGLTAEEVADTVLYVLGTPPTVLIREVKMSVVA